MVRVATLAAGAALVLGSSSATAQDKPKEEEIIIPASAMPPEGMCRVWLKDVPERSQPAATDCATAGTAKANSAMPAASVASVLQSISGPSPAPVLARVRNPIRRQSRKLLKLSGMSAMSFFINAMAACKSSRLAPVTRTASP